MGTNIKFRIETDKKRLLRSALAMRGKTMTDFFMEAIDKLIETDVVYPTRKRKKKCLK